MNHYVLVLRPKSEGGPAFVARAGEPVAYRSYKKATEEGQTQHGCITYGFAVLNEKDWDLTVEGGPL